MKPFVLECDVACFRALGVKIDKAGSCVVSNTGASNPILNCVYSFDGNDTQIELNAKQIVDGFNTQGLPYCWWTEAMSEPPQLIEILRGQGKELLGEFLGMALEVSGIERGPAAPELAISRVSSQTELSSWGAIIAEVFEFNEVDEELYTSLFAQAGTDGPFYHLVGKRGEKVVSTGTILCTEEGAYIYNVATTEAERAKGFGRSVIEALLEIAIHNNQTRVALVSPVGVASIYRKLGFQEICRFRIYV